MFVADCFDVNEKGHLTIGGCDTVGLAKEYGTPLYVMDEMTIRQACRLYQKSFQENYDGHGMAFYASKALNCKELCRIVAEEGEVVEEVRTEAELSGDDDLVTEDLAEIYLAQGLYDEAIAIYRKLSLLNPEKSVYFASLIDKIANK